MTPAHPNHSFNRTRRFVVSTWHASVTARRLTCSLGAMSKSTHLRRWTSLLYALAAVVPVASWLLLLFYAKPPSQSPLEAAVSMLRATFAPEDPRRWWFIGWAALPICFLVLAAMYISPISLRRSWAIALFCVSLMATAYSLVAVPPLGVHFVSCTVLVVSLRPWRLTLRSTGRADLWLLLGERRWRRAG